MASTLPDFASLPVVTPQPVGQIPQLSETDAIAAGEHALGTGLQEAGKAAETISAYGKIGQTRMDRAMADADFTGNVIALNEQLKTETDPAKIATYPQQYQDALSRAAGAFSDPDAAKMWSAERSHVIAQGTADASLRSTVLQRQSAGAQQLSQLDNLARLGAAASDPTAFPAALKQINDLTDAMPAAGTFSAEEAYRLKRSATSNLVRGNAEALINSGNPDAAAAFLQQHIEDVDAPTLDALTAKAQAKGAALRIGGAASRALGIAVPAPTNYGDMSAAPAAPNQYRPLIDQASASTGVPAELLTRLLSAENSFQPTGVSSAGARGIAQFMPETAQRYGVNPDDPTSAIPGAARYLKDLHAQTGSWLGALHGYLGGDPTHDVSYMRNGVPQLAIQLDRAGSTPAARTSGGFDLAGGDSIAYGAQRFGGLGGVGVGSVAQPEAATADAAGGRNPQQGLDYIEAHPERFAGKTVLWSSGLMNAGVNGAQTALPIVAQQLDALKKAGANVVLAGVDQGKFSQYNGALAAIANDKGIPFAGPLPTEDIHPSPAGYKQYAANAATLIPSGGAPDQVAGQGATPAAAQAPAAPNRTGLPSLADVWQNIQSDPSLQNENERLLAFNHAKTFYDAQEADAARTQRLAIMQQQQAMRAREDQVWADVYGSNPKITAQQIATDPAFSGNPERRKAMIDLINNPPGSSVPAAQSYAAAQSMIDRMRLPQGDPNKITTRDQIYDQMRGLNRSDLDFVLKKYDELSAPGDTRFSQRVEEFFKGTTPQIDRSGALPGLPNDDVGKAKSFEYRRMVEDQVDQYRKAGKNPDDLINPKKPDYLGSPDTLKPYKRTLQQALADFQTENNGPLGAGDADLSTPDGLKSAVASGKITREQGEAEALRRGWIRPAEPAPATAPETNPLMPLGQP